MNQKNLYRIVSFVLLLIVIILVFYYVYTSSFSHKEGYYQRGSFRKSCNINTETPNLLKANCKDMYGNYQYTELKNPNTCKYDIANCRGKLRCGSC
jgi:hypothetical protein